MRLRQTADWEVAAEIDGVSISGHACTARGDQRDCRRRRSLSALTIKPSNKTYINSSGDICSAYQNRYPLWNTHTAMGSAITAGSDGGGYRLAGRFRLFDYNGRAIRGLQNIQTICLYAIIDIGEDGLTHQSVAHLAAMAIPPRHPSRDHEPAKPGVRPSNDTMPPLFSRQKGCLSTAKYADAKGSTKKHILPADKSRKATTPLKLIIIATGSEVTRVRPHQLNADGTPTGRLDAAGNF
jgi:transketolase